MSHHSYQQEHRGGNIGSFIAGAVVGGLVGAGIALLQAPQSGKRTREEIQQKVDEVRHQAEDVMSTAKEHGKEAADEISSHAQEVKKEAQSAMQTAKSEGREAAEEAKQTMREGEEEIRRKTHR